MQSQFRMTRAGVVNILQQEILTPHYKTRGLMRIFFSNGAMDLEIIKTLVNAIRDNKVTNLQHNIFAMRVLLLNVAVLSGSDKILTRPILDAIDELTDNMLDRIANHTTPIEYFILYRSQHILIDKKAWFMKEIESYLDNISVQDGVDLSASTIYRSYVKQLKSRKIIEDRRTEQIEKIILQDNFEPQAKMELYTITRDIKYLGKTVHDMFIF